MTPGTFFALYLAGSLSFRLTRLVIAIRAARACGRGRTTAKPMFWVMTIGFLAYVAACAAEGWREMSAFHWPIAIVGFLLYCGALALREKAMRDLGRFFSPDIEIRRDHGVVREGLYRYVRHPLLACMMIEVIGVGLVFNAWQSLLILGGGFYLPLLLVRWQLEERTLQRSLGDAYRRYQKEVGAFWPRVLHG